MGAGLLAFLRSALEPSVNAGLPRRTPVPDRCGKKDGDFMATFGRQPAELTGVRQGPASVTGSGPAPGTFQPTVGLIRIGSDHRGQVQFGPPETGRDALVDGSHLFAIASLLVAPAPSSPPNSTGQDE
jgi:hypothetical protein